MGASGVGKDSLLHYLRAQLHPSAQVMLPKRYITRPSDLGGEGHIEVSRETFQQQMARGEFAMHWESHGYAYGISRDINTWLKAGLKVVINGSRHYLEEARRRYADLIPVLITVSPEVLRSRLVLRGRENAAEIEQRLRRGEELESALARLPLIRLSNDGPLPVAGDSLIELILNPADSADSHDKPG